MTLRHTAILWTALLLLAAYIGGLELSIALGLTDRIPTATDLTP